MKNQRVAARLRFLVGSHRWSRVTAVEVGEVWVYRASGTAPVVQVEVKRIGTERPARVQIKYLPDEFEGREEWVPPARLKVLWSQVDAWLAREGRWEAVRRASTHIRGEAEEDAAFMVLDHLRLAGLTDGLVDCGLNRSIGVMLLRDPSGAAAELGIDIPAIKADPLAFVDDDGTLVAPWRATHLVLELLAKRHSDTLLRELEAQETKYRAEALHGDKRHSEFLYEYIRTDLEPAWALVRSWCGVEAVERYDELTKLRGEVRRLGTLVNRAALELRQAGQVETATSLERELGVSIEDLRARYS